MSLSEVQCPQKATIIGAENFSRNPNADQTLELLQEQCAVYCITHCGTKCQARQIQNTPHIASTLRLEVLKSAAQQFSTTETNLE